MAFEWTPESRLQAAQNALAYIVFLHSRPAGTGMTEAENFLTSILNDLTDAGADSHEAVLQMFSGMGSLMNLTLQVSADKYGIPASEMLEELGARLAHWDG